MKYQAAKIKKMEKIAVFVQREVKIGKCDYADIEDILEHIRAMVVSYDDLMALKAAADRGEI